MPMFKAFLCACAVLLNPNLREKRNFGGKDSSGKWVGDKLQEGNAIIDLKPFVRQLVLVFSIYTYILSYSGFAGLRLQGCTRL